MNLNHNLMVKSKNVFSYELTQKQQWGVRFFFPMFLPDIERSAQVDSLFVSISWRKLSFWQEAETQVCFLAAQEFCEIPSFSFSPRAGIKDWSLRKPEAAANRPLA